MKAILEFTLPEDTEEHDIHMQAIPMAVFISNFGAYIRRKYKHAEFPGEDAFKEYESIRTMWYDMLNEAGLED